MHWKPPFPLASFHQAFISLITFAKDSWEDRGIGRVCGHLMCFILKCFNIFYWMLQCIEKIEKKTSYTKNRKRRRKKTEYVSKRNLSKAQVVLVPPLNSVFGSWREWPCLACGPAADGPCHVASMNQGRGYKLGYKGGRSHWGKVLFHWEERLVPPRPGRVSYPTFACEAATVRVLKSLFKDKFSLKFQDRQTRIQCAQIQRKQKECFLTGI